MLNVEQIEIMAQPTMYQMIILTSNLSKNVQVYFSDVSKTCRFFSINLPGVYLYTVTTYINMHTSLQRERTDVI